MLKGTKEGPNKRLKNINLWFYWREGLRAEKRMQVDLREAVELKILEGFDIESRDSVIKLKRGGVRLTIEPLGDKFIIKRG